MTEFPELIASLFRTLKVTKNGCYELVIRINGIWQVILLDNYFPCSKIDKKPIFSKPNGVEIWAMLMEKAWAKVNEGYRNTILGLSSDVLVAFTGYPSIYMNIESYFNNDYEKIWKIIKDYDEKDYILTTSTYDDISGESVGLVAGHAFTLISAKETNIKSQNIRLLKIRNPWGNREWNGKWSDNSPLWNDETRKIFSHYKYNDNDGCFWIEFNDYIKYFEDIHACFKL